MTAVIFTGGDPSKVNVGGYVKGDLLAANLSGSLSALHVGVNTKVLTADSSASLGLSYQTGGGGSPPPVNLVDAATIATDASLSNSFRVTIVANRIMGIPTNPTDGQMIIWEITQGAGGSHTLTLTGGVGGFKLGTDLASITLSTGAGITDVLGARYNLPKNQFEVLAFMRGF